MSSATADKSNFNIFEHYQERIGLLDGFQLQQLEGYQVIDGLEPELIKIAIDKAADNSKRSFGYVNSILKSWAQNGIKTVAQQNEEQRVLKVARTTTINLLNLAQLVASIKRYCL